MSVALNDKFELMLYNLRLVLVSLAVRRIIHASRFLDICLKNSYEMRKTSGSKKEASFAIHVGLFAPPG